MKYLSAPGGQAGLARYTYRAAIWDDRIESVRDGRVTFWYKDYARGGRRRRMTVSADQFLRRFLLHVLPRGLVRVRSFGFLAGPRLRFAGPTRRQLFATVATAESPRGPPDPPPASEMVEPFLCPHCGQGLLRVVARVPRPSISELACATYWTEYFDRS